MVYWSATRGEAGQNRIGSHSGDALGIYRTWESIAARAIGGGESWYGPFYDFGYGTSGPEAVAKWGWEALVREIVRAIRLVQPQVLVGRYSGEASDGHGQHQAIGAATVEAFDAAADPARFPELGLPVWQTSKLYQSTDGDWQAGEQHTSGQRRPEFERDETCGSTPANTIQSRECHTSSRRCLRSTATRRRRLVSSPKLAAISTITG